VVGEDVGTGVGSDVGVVVSNSACDIVGVIVGPRVADSGSIRVGINVAGSNVCSGVGAMVTDAGTDRTVLLCLSIRSFSDAVTNRLSRNVPTTIFSGSKAKTEYIKTKRHCIGNGNGGIFLLTWHPEYCVCV